MLHNIHLLTIGVFNLGATLTGRQRRPSHEIGHVYIQLAWALVHILIYRFYVDNGGIFLFGWFCNSHPLNREQNH